MKVYAISDLHLATNANKPMDVCAGWENHIDKICEDWRQKVQAEDVVLLCGDLSWAMQYKDAVQDIDLIGSLPGRKVIIKGNHDYWWQSITQLRASLPKGMYALQNDIIQLPTTTAENARKLVICGTRGWFVGSSEQDKKIYHREVERLKLSLQSLKKQASPNDIILAMSHYPPYGAQVSKTPFTDLYTEYGIQTVVYGHLHGTHNRTPQKVQIDNTQYILTSCDLVGHKLVEIF